MSIASTTQDDVVNTTFGSEANSRYHSAVLTITLDAVKFCRYQF